MIPYFCVLLGLVFIWLEFYLPGGAFAVAAAICSEWQIAFYL